ncbi:DinB family protein [Friedmanniella luteola]|uniref:DinB family protein n=1 Tax=Friedmanniella luteola TaxID=546871 RepID=UPI000B809D3C|nr:DinB family protein [Friedmanniella luteola]
MDPKAVLQRYLTEERRNLLSRLDGLSERDVRWPGTPTGTNLLGLVKHVASIELGYLGDVFDRPSGIPLPWLDDDAEPDADLWATAEESRDDVLALHHAAAAHADATIDALDLDAPGVVPWWAPERRQVTLQQVLVHVVAETAHHAGHADVLRELLDGRAGDDRGNLTARSPAEWAAHRRRLEAVAEAVAPS